MQLIINSKQYVFEEEITILEACKQVGVVIPTLCHSELLEPYGSCFLCVVELKSGRGGLVPSCATSIAPDMIIETDNDNVRSTRKMALELLLSDHFGDCYAPCQIEGCPAEIDIQGFLSLEKEGRYIEAAALIREKAPFPMALGRVCPKPCEAVCRRSRVDEPVSIGIQKRFIVEKEIEQGGPFLPEVQEPGLGKKVVIIGAGPGGLTVAYYLRLMGHSVTIYEKESKAGGMMRYGIPFYRFPEDLLDIEVNAIIDQLDVNVKFNVEVGKDILITDLEKKFDAIVIANGAQLSYKLGIEGEHHSGVYVALDVLNRIAKQEAVSFGDEVLVVGGGHTAMDSARSAIRLGAKATVLYRRSFDEMPAKDEVHEAEEEGVKFVYLAAPVKVEKISNDKLNVTVIKNELSSPDSSGRCRPVPVKGSEYTLVVDSIVTAIGQKPDFSMLPTELVKDNGWLNVEGSPFQLPENEKFFAIGDCVTGPDLVVTAVAQGRQVSVAINQFLLGEKVVGPSLRFTSRTDELSRLPQEMFDSFDKFPKNDYEFVDPQKRVKSFDDIEKSWSETKIKNEASRCLSCGCVELENCNLKKYAEEYKADSIKFYGDRRKYQKDSSHKDLVMEIDKCINCSACVRVCEDIKKFYVFGFQERGFGSRVSLGPFSTLEKTDCDGCLKCVEVCPTAGVHKKDLL